METLENLFIQTLKALDEFFLFGINSNKTPKQLLKILDEFKVLEEIVYMDLDLNKFYPWSEVQGLGLGEIVYKSDTINFSFDVKSTFIVAERIFSKKKNKRELVTGKNWVAR